MRPAPRAHRVDFDGTVPQEPGPRYWLSTRSRISCRRCHRRIHGPHAEAVGLPGIVDGPLCDSCLHITALALTAGEIGA